MSKFATITMYVLWTVAIVSVLATTFTNFQYTDLNFLAMLFLIFAIVNSFFIASRAQKEEEE